MSNQEPGEPRRDSTTDQILDLLLDALVERQRARKAGRGAPAAPPVPPEAKLGVPSPRPEPSHGDQRRLTPRKPSPVKPVPATRPQGKARAPGPGEVGWEPAPQQPSINLGKMMGWC